MSQSGHANLSARTAPDRFVLTTSGSVPDLTADQLATVDIQQGDIIKGVLAAESVAMHSVIYRARPHVGAVIHTHSLAATAFALAHRPVALPRRAAIAFRPGRTGAGHSMGPRG